MSDAGSGQPDASVVPRFSDIATFMRRATEDGLIEPSRVVQLGLRGSRFSDADIRYGRDAGYTVITFDDYEDMGRAGAPSRPSPARSVAGRSMSRSISTASTRPMRRAPGCPRSAGWCRATPR